jgi:hypothetical protein
VALREPFPNDGKHVFGEALPHAVDVPATEGRVGMANAETVEASAQNSYPLTQLGFLSSRFDHDHPRSGGMRARHRACTVGFATSVLSHLTSNGSSVNSLGSVRLPSSAAADGRTRC